MSHLDAKDQLIYSTSISADSLTVANGQISVVKDGENAC